MPPFVLSVLRYPESKMRDIRGLHNLIIPSIRWRPRAGLVVAILMLVVVGLMTALYLWTQIEVTIVVNDHPYRFYTHQTSVKAVLREAGLEIHEEDIVLPRLDAPLPLGEAIVVRQARPVIIEVDGKIIERRTHTRTVADLLSEVAIFPKAHDRITIDGQAADLETSLTAYLSDSFPSRDVGGRGGRLLGGQYIPNPDLAPVRVVLRRAVPIHISDGGVPTTIYTTDATVGEALRAHDIILHLGDRVIPSLDSRISTDMRVYIQRSKPVEIVVDGQTIRTRTRKETVAEVLAQEGVALFGKDYISFREDQRITDSMVIRVVRVREEIAIEQDPMPFETVWRPDAEMEIDQRRLEQEGQEGMTKRRLRIAYEDGWEVRRTMEDEWIDREAKTKVIAYGTYIVSRDLETPEGTFQYWRKVRVLATSYTAATSGKERDHPEYGLTFSGLKASKGVIAVDPKVINLEARIYVPGYGLGVAGDTGGQIKGRHIDLGYDESNLVMWYKWVDAYLLDLPPPENQIRWVLPNWPREHR